MQSTDRAISTRLVHAGEPQERVEGAVVLPIFQSATFSLGTPGDEDPVHYLRYSNTPNHRALHAKLAAVSGGEAALVTGSGMAAISAALLTLLRSGEHLLVQSGLYGGTQGFLQYDLAELNIGYSPIDGNRPDTWEAALQPKTRAVYVECLSNPLLEVADLEAVVDFCRRYELISVIDNTFASPVNFRPLEWGFDVEIHSATKYLNGHSDIVAGCIMGNRDFIERARRKLNALGGSLDAHTCFLLQRGLKTLALRMGQQNDNALALARLLAEHPAVEKVNYPLLEGHPQQQRAQRLFEGCGGVFSFEVKGDVAAAEGLVGRLELAIYAPSLGGVETLIGFPARTSHVGLSPQERSAMRVSDKMIRVAAGIEATADLCADFTQALDALA
ncbi:MAG: aminotransferase class I/II-fold pyridoxal phosphate-dependent enzyme [Candidatus Latescibacteria bacterium]|nr:aminotransferase class I/II-fold pyridoxal phosphate-dependent enzyme [Candidatus Latescibacterota bacterium]